jgi:PAS domain S-box-containing protein
MDYSDRGILQQLFVDSLPDCALILLDVDGNILTWNTGARAMYGYPASEIVGRHFSGLYIQADVDAAKPLMSLAGAMAHGRQEETGQRLHRDGTAFEVREVLIPLYDPQKKLVAFGNLTLEVGHSTRAVAAPTAIPAVPAPPAPGLRIVPAERRKKVLLVDDDEAVRAASVGLLSSLGYQVIAASSGAEALDLLTRFDDIDVLFTDVVMPGGMDGGEVAKRATALRPGMKVLFASGYFEGALVREGNIAANAHFLVKPYRKKDLARMMDEVLGPEVSAA